MWWQKEDKRQEGWPGYAATRPERLFFHRIGDSIIPRRGASSLTATEVLFSIWLQSFRPATDHSHLFVRPFVSLYVSKKDSYGENVERLICVTRTVWYGEPEVQIAPTKTLKIKTIKKKANQMIKKQDYLLKTKTEVPETKTKFQKKFKMKC